MKKRDRYWLSRLLYSLIIVVIFFFISFLNIIQFNSSYMDEEIEELQVFTKQIEWAVLPYLNTGDYNSLNLYAKDFENEDIAIRIFNSRKKLIMTSRADTTSPLADDSHILNTTHSKWHLYKHSIKDQQISKVKEIKTKNGDLYYLEVTISEADLMSTIIKGQAVLMVFFGICVFLLLLSLLEALYKTKTTFDGFENSVIKIANGDLDTPIDVPNLELLEELSISVKKMTLRLKNQIFRLKQLEEYKSNFLQNITHEIKTPITAINSAIELIENNQNSQSDNQECFEIIKFQTNSINKLVNDILSLSEIESAKNDEQKHFTRFNLNNMVEKTISIFLYQFPNINFIQNANIEITGNEELLSTALANLLSNAIRYSGGEKIDVIVDKNQDKPEIKVRDYGVGIAPEHLGKIFEKFYRVDKARSRKSGGTGLGLAIVKNIIELHNGTIEVESIPDTGTVFTIFL